jgi:tripartite-type tricarboxylate transporter receptor subunit TctC
MIQGCIRVRIGTAVLLMSASCVYSPVHAADSYPSKPIKIVVPFSAGGTGDQFARILARQMEAKLNQSVMVEDRPGAASNIGVAYVARSDPDGYTLLMSGNPLSVNQSLYKSLPYKQSDLAPISLVAKTPYILVVNPSLPVKNVRELIAYTKAHPGAINFGSAGVGGGEHLAGELLNQMAGIDMTHIPYKSAPQVLTDLIGGKPQVAFASMLTTVPLIKAGQIRALGFTSDKRSDLLPEVPTVSESGLPKFEAFGWYGLLAPAKTPTRIIARLNSVVVNALRDPTVTKSLAQTGIEVVGDTPAEFSAFISSDTRAAAALVKHIGIAPE